MKSSPITSAVLVAFLPAILAAESGADKTVVTVDNFVRTATDIEYAK
jgi:hypothetical protein